MTPKELAESLLAAALSAFPQDPEVETAMPGLASAPKGPPGADLAGPPGPSGVETIVGYELVTGESAPGIPDQFWAPRWGPAEPLAAKMVQAVLDALTPLVGSTGAISQFDFNTRRYLKAARAALDKYTG